MCARRSMLAASLLLVLGATAAARPPSDPVEWQLRIDRAEMWLRHAEADLQWQRRVLDWTIGVPVEEEVGQLAIVAGRDADRREYRAVSRELERLERAVAEAEAEVRRRELELEEMGLSQRPPRDDLWGGLVQERDFVSERMNVRLEMLNRVVKILAARYEMVQFLANQRAVPWRDLVEVEAEVEVVQARIEKIELELVMRRLYLDDELPDDAMFILQEQDLDRRQKIIEARLARAGWQLERIEPLVSRGFAGQMDFDEAEHQKRAIEQEREALQMERRMYDHRVAKWLERRGDD